MAEPEDDETARRRDRDRRVPREGRPGRNDAAGAARLGRAGDGRRDEARHGAGAGNRGGAGGPGRELTPAEIEERALEGHQIAGRLERDEALRILRDGEITIVGRLLGASNATLYCIVRVPCPEPGGEPDVVATAVYKPIRGERPLADFPDGTLAYREVAAYTLSEATGWGIVPPTILRDGPLGVGMLQLWVEVEDSVDVVELVSRPDDRLRRIAVFDAAANNADRKGGHLLPTAEGHVYGVDHGLCFSPEPKLRTILWGWRGDRFSTDEIAVLERLRSDLGGDLGARLRELIAGSEVRATLRRVDALLAHRRFPLPDRNRPVIPWPPF